MKPIKTLNFDGATVAELINALKTLDQNKPVWIPDYAEETMHDVERIIEETDAVHIWGVPPAPVEDGTDDGGADGAEPPANELEVEILTIEDLRGQRCDCGSQDCSGAIYFHPHCHPNAGTWTSYDDVHRWLNTQCRECGEAVLRILLPQESENYHDQQNSRN